MLRCRKIYSKIYTQQFRNCKLHKPINNITKLDTDQLKESFVYTIQKKTLANIQNIL